MNQDPKASNDTTQVFHRVDEVGITFIDVLFALVVSRILAAATDASSLPAHAISHLLVAAALTTFSWVGYHNSANRPQYPIRFINLPFWQFLIDVLLVGDYWFVAATVEYVPEISARPNSPTSAQPEALGVFLAFILYALWDEVSRRIYASSRYADDTDGSEGSERLRRRRVTWVFSLMSTAVFVVTLVWMPRDGGKVVALDVALLLILAFYRIAKDWPAAKFKKS
ncbi:hypothetical protein [Streptomyces sp. NPDC047706]|uniref:hypothetical protein n=1 Tax=Streptomyces sp. NPDC047706 TaxID=3365486 RepID=UPI0037118A9D